MSPTVYLHIGAPKTGTTYLQDRLGRNASALADHDVHFPSRSAIVSPGLFHFRAALDLLGQDWGGAPGHAEGSWDALARRVRRKSGTVVISHEILAPAAPDAVARAMQDLGPDVHVVYTARDLGRQVPAAWQESIKQGRRWRYSSFVRRMDKRQDLVLAGLRHPHGARPLGCARARRRTSTWSPCRRPGAAGPATTSGTGSAASSGSTPPGRRSETRRRTSPSAWPRRRAAAAQQAARSRKVAPRAGYDGLSAGCSPRTLWSSHRLGPRHAAAGQLRVGRGSRTERWHRVDRASRHRRRRRPRRAAPALRDPEPPGATPTGCRRRRSARAAVDALGGDDGRGRPSPGPAGHASAQPRLRRAGCPARQARASAKAPVVRPRPRAPRTPVCAGSASRGRLAVGVAADPPGDEARRRPSPDQAADHRHPPADRWWRAACRRPSVISSDATAPTTIASRSGSWAGAVASAIGGAGSSFLTIR